MQAPALARCDLEAGNEVPVAGTPWMVAVRGYACGFGIGGIIDLVAINTSSETITVLAEGDDLGKANIKQAKDGSITISIPNLSDILIRAKSFGNINVTYEYYPHDEPDARRRYFAWVHDKKNEDNRMWYCSHIVPTMIPRYQKINDELLAWSVYSPHGSRKSYCNPP